MQKLMVRTFLLIISLSTSLSINAVNKPEVKPLSGFKPNRILFVGNSYLYYNDSLHNHVKRMVGEKFPRRKKLLIYKSSTIGGSRLAHHNLDHLLDVKNIGVRDNFELVILQGGSSETLSKKSRRQFHEHAEKMIGKIKASGGKAALYMPHAYVEPHKKYSPGMVDDIKSTYVKAGNDNETLVIPVGLAFEMAYRIKPDIKLHKEFDGTHPSLLGTYLAANVVFATLFKSSPIGLEYNYFDTISDEDREFLQKIATVTVAEFFK